MISIFMYNRKELKQKARTNLKKHYLLFVAICLVSAFLGIEFRDNLSIFKIGSDDNVKPSGIVSMSSFSNGEILSLDMIDYIIFDEEDNGKKLAQAITDNKKESNSKYMGRSEGVFATALNSIESGSIILQSFDTIHSITGSRNISIIILILLFFVFNIFIWLFIQETYIVISRRLFLEGRIYKELDIFRFLYIANPKRWIKTACTMFVTFLIKFLLCLTIVGIPYAIYSYCLVPYIIAENPDIKSKYAIRLSRQIMNGHKWEMFLVDLSFIGWYILDFFARGLIGIFFINPYRVCLYSEYYAEFRKIAKSNNIDIIDNVELLNDKYLFEKPDYYTLQQTYSDIVPSLNKPMPKLETLNGFTGFLANWFGILFYSSKKEIEFEKQKSRYIHLAKLKDEACGNSYPIRLFPTDMIPFKIKSFNINYSRNYSIVSLILMFFIFSFGGWLWEVAQHIISDGVFVNRGVLHGPWLPIYGAGSVAVLLILNKFRDKPIAEFVTTIILCGCLEYFASWYLEFTHGGQKWWSYDGYFLNLNGRICAEGLLVFGIGGLLVVYLIAPLLDNLIRKINLKLAITICIVLLSIYICDATYSIKNPNTGPGVTTAAANIPVRSDNSYY